MILDEPLVAVGGFVSSDTVITFYMHRGYDRPNGYIEPSIAHLKGLPTGGYEFCDRSNPLFSWPIYARVERREASR